MKNKATRLLAVALSLVTAFSVLRLTAAAASELTIKSYAQLKQFAESVNNGNTYENKNVRLSVNIDLGGSENPWKPIGTASNPFKGSFDGGNHVISGLSISTGSNIGFFGYVNGGTVENLTVSGSVTGSSNIAGVVGYLKTGTVKSCGNKANVTGTSAVGGIVGAFNGACTAEGCYNSGSISGTTGYIGGIVGQGANSSSVKSCYNKGAVSGPATVGGIGGSHKAYTVSYSDCFHAGTVTDTAGNGNNIGTIAGATRGSVTNCYYLKNSGKNTKGYGTEKESISAELLSSAFTTGTPYPVLAWEGSVCTDSPVHPEFIEATERSALLASYIKEAVKSTKAHSEIEATLLGNEKYKAGASSTSTDWMALAMGRFGYFDNGKYRYMIDDGTGYEDYLEAMKKYIEDTYTANNGILHRAKATEWHRAVVTVSALGGNPTAFGIYNGKPIDLIADGSYNCVISSGPGKQGMNGWIWGLIALDTGMYELPADAKYTRERFITEILRLQLTDGVNGNKYGGWVLGGYGSSSDVDITAMAVQALAPYYNDDTVYTYTNTNSKTEVSKTVRKCIDEALDRLGSMMNSNAGFSSWNTDNAESISQVAVALCSVGINPAEDERFITSDGKTLLDGLLRFRLSDGGFCHVLNGGWNSMANDQATYALVAWWRLENNMRALYDMRGKHTDEEAAAINNAVKAIDGLLEPSASDYKASIKNALTVFNKIPANERRYVSNYSKLAAALELIGGKDELDTNTPYITSVSVSKKPNKLIYFEGEAFDTSGMTVTAAYSDGHATEITDYRLSLGGSLKAGTSEIYVIYGIFKERIAITVNEKMPWAGDGTRESPYIIGTAEELKALADRVNKGKSFTGTYFALSSHIDLSNISSWTPIGKSASYQFDGYFDGNGFMIDNLYSTTGGLFGYVGNNAVIQNTGVASGEINAFGSSFIGGIAKWSNGADIINCMNGADIKCGGYSGGIVGTVRDGGKSTVKGCFNIGEITSSGSSVGGIIGHLDTTRSGYVTVNVTASDCYNTGKITASDDAGGIVGRAQDGHTIDGCYNAGEITLTGAVTAEGAGGIAGILTSNNEIKNCYYLSGVISGTASGNTGDITAKTEEEMMSDKFVSLLSEAFKEDRYSLVNGGFPVLYWQSTDTADEIDGITEIIASIGNVTLESEAAIKAARSAYEELSKELRPLVENYGILEKAEEALKLLKSSKPEKLPNDSAAENEADGNNKSDASSNTEAVNLPQTGEKISVTLATTAMLLAAVSVICIIKKRKITVEA